MTPNEPRSWKAHLPPGFDVEAIDVLAQESLPKAWTKRWALEARAIVALMPDGSRLSAGELEDRSRQVAGRLASAGMGPGDRILISASASLDLLVVYVAAHRLGLIIVPMNTSYGPTEVRAIVTNTTPSMAVVDDRDSVRSIDDAADGHIWIVGSDVSIPTSEDPILDKSDRTTPALICHTSGTTGVPKGAVLTSGNLLASAEAVRLAWRWTPDDRLALALPLFHLHGLGVGINGTLLSGASAILLGQFEPKSLGEAIADQSATMFFGVPTMYHRLAFSPSLSQSLRSLRLCVSGSAPLPSELHGRIKEAFGQAVLERYGMTETVMNLSNPYDGERRAGTVGFPLPGVEMRLESNNNGVDGEIQLRGPNVFRGYWNQPGATSESFTSDGWFASGDLAAVDDDGYVQIVGRSKELIISGGYNVYPKEIEDILRAHGGIEDVAVLGVPSEEWGETVTAVVVANGSITADSIIEFAAQHLAPYKRPRIVRFVETLPRNALGKVQKDLLTA